MSHLLPERPEDDPVWTRPLTDEQFSELSNEEFQKTYKKLHQKGQVTYKTYQSFLIGQADRAQRSRAKQVVEKDSKYARYNALQLALATLQEKKQHLDELHERCVEKTKEVRIAKLTRYFTDSFERTVINEYKKKGALMEDL